MKMVAKQNIKACIDFTHAQFISASEREGGLAPNNLWDIDTQKIKDKIEDLFYSFLFFMFH